MRKRGVPMSFQVRVFYYLKYAIDGVNSLSSNHEVIYKLLSPSFREQLLTDAVGNKLLSKPVFSAYSEPFLQSLLLHIEEKIFSPEDLILKVL
jgi:hypothetical protein